MSKAAITLPDSKDAEIARQRDRIEELEGLLHMGFHLYTPPEYGMTPSQARLLGALATHKMLTRDAAMTLLYGARPECDQPDIKIIDVMVCKMRKRLAPHGIEIKRQWGVGYFLEDEVRERLRARIAGGGEATQTQTT